MSTRGWSIDRFLLRSSRVFGLACVTYLKCDKFDRSNRCVFDDETCQMRIASVTSDNNVCRFFAFRQPFIEHVFREVCPSRADSVSQSYDFSVNYCQLINSGT